MAIPIDKLKNWSNPGKNENSQATYAKMRKIIEENIENNDVFLQGSYANATNVRDNSDIDVVVVLKNWKYNTSTNKDVKLARDHIYNALNGKGGFQFIKGNKTVKYKGSVNFVPADIVPCVEYNEKNYNGIVIYDHLKNTNIVNYPKLHIEER